ncbi:hypothetical protein [Rhizobium lusitanum]|uniref:Uncharacterized protein n=1 Tax=Rhizobium lusitanum TaxID=293958 RepID=A0A7X0IWW0_9HYPH|nr:hypothetical protein [Rhizobium lusitanum]MBB6488673.1 hypothetical protein [Rhizobium lusitanum]
MNVDKVIAVVSAAGIELTDRRRTISDDGWSLSFANGAELQIGDDGKINASGKGADSVLGLLDLRSSGATKSKAQRPRTGRPSHFGGS